MMSEGVRRKDVDGGWAWMVFLASFMNLLLSSGIAFVSGIFQKLFLEQFGKSVSYTAWVTALFNSFLMLGGPLSGMLTSATNCRVTVMIGGAMLSGGLAASSFATSLEFMLVTFGLISGIGLGLFYTPSIVIVNYFFDRRRTLIMGLTLSASGIGITCTPVLSQFLIDQFSWREMMMILAAIAAHVCVFGALMFPVHEGPSTCLRRCQSSSKSGDMETGHRAAGNSAPVDRQYVCSQEKSGPTLASSMSDSGVQLDPEEVLERDLDVVHIPEGVHDDLILAERIVLLGTTDRPQIIVGSVETQKTLVDQHRLLQVVQPSHLSPPQHEFSSGTSLKEVPNHRKGAQYFRNCRTNRRKLSHSFHHLDRLNHPAPCTLANSSLTVGDRATSRGSRLNVRTISIFSSVHSLHSWGLPKIELVTSPPLDSDGDTSDTEQDESVGGGVDWTVFRNAPFLILCLCMFLSNMAIAIFNIHLPAFFQQRGLDDHDITSVIASYGLSLCLSRMLLGALGNDDRVDKLAVFFGQLVISSCVQIAMPLFHSLTAMSVVGFMMGAYHGSSYALLTSLTISMLGLPSLAFGFGLEMISAGLGYLVAPPLAGRIVDMTGNYDHSMYLGGFLMLLSALVLLCISCARPKGAPPVGYNPPPPDSEVGIQAEKKTEEDRTER